MLFINLVQVREPFSFSCGHATLLSTNGWSPLDNISFHHSTRSSFGLVIYPIVLYMSSWDHSWQSFKKHFILYSEELVSVCYESMAYISCLKFTREKVLARWR